MKIKEKCLKAQKQERFQGTDEIAARINKRSHTLRRTIIATVACIVLFLGYSTIRYTEVFNSWWDSFLIVTPDVQHDVASNHTLYRILSETDRTCEAVGHQYVIRVAAEKRDAFREFLHENGVETDIHYPVPVHLQPCYASLPHGALPVSEKLASESVSLPIGDHISEMDAREIAEIINQFK